MATGTGNLPYPGKVYVPFDILTAQELNEDVANIESLATGTGIGDGSVTTSSINNGAVTVAKLNLGAAKASVLTSQASAIQTYHNSLGTAGPAVTVTIGSSGLALVAISARLGSNSTTAGTAFVSFAISGATTRAASDDSAINYQVFAANAFGQYGYTELVTGLTAGSNTFTMNYRVPADTGTFANRKISVIPL